MAPEETIAKYRGKFMQGWDKLREERYARQIKSGLISSDWKMELRPAEIPAWDSLSEKEKTRYDDMMAIYAAMIEEVDKNIGTLLAELRKRDQLDNTLILFLSDNGGNAEAGINGKYKGENPGDKDSDVFIGRCWAHLNNTPFRKYKHYNHEGGTASPLIAYWPANINPLTDSQKNDWIEKPTHVIDIMATCADLGNAKYPQKVSGKRIIRMQGQSLRPLLTGNGKFAERTLYWEHEGNAAVRIGERKLVRQGLRGKWELFDLKSDRTEQNDLAAENAEEVKRLSANWRAWAKSVNAIPKPASKKKKNRQKKNKN